MLHSYTRSLWAEWWGCGSLWRTPPLTTAACGSSQDHTRVSPPLLCFQSGCSKDVCLRYAVWSAQFFPFMISSAPFFPGGISRRMVRTPPGTFPLTDFVGREQNYDDEKFIPVPVKKGKTLRSISAFTWIFQFSGLNWSPGLTFRFFLTFSL